MHLWNAHCCSHLITSYNNNYNCSSKLVIQQELQLLFNKMLNSYMLYLESLRPFNIVLIMLLTEQRNITIKKVATFWTMKIKLLKTWILLSTRIQHAYNHIACHLLSLQNVEQFWILCHYSSFKLIILYHIPYLTF